jgi:hypothetical protein
MIKPVDPAKRRWKSIPNEFEFVLFPVALPRSSRIRSKDCKPLAPPICLEIRSLGNIKNRGLDNCHSKQTHRLLVSDSSSNRTLLVWMSNLPTFHRVNSPMDAHRRIAEVERILNGRDTLLERTQEDLEDT